MSLDLMTLITVFIAVWMCRSSTETMLILFLSAILFQSAAAVKFGALGVTPGHALLAVPILTVFASASRRAALLDLMRFPVEGYWLFVLSLYSFISGYFLPWIFSTSTYVYPIGTTMFEPSTSVVPLGPSSGNLTQSIYILGSLLVYLAIGSLTRSAVGVRHMSHAIIIYTVLNIVFAILDLVTYWAGIGDSLSFIHNGNYSLHLDEADVGLKRIAGAFSEAAAFATASLGTLAFTLRLCVGGIRPLFTGVLTLIQIVLIVLSTSSTGYGGLGVVFAVFYLQAVVLSVRRAPPLGFVAFVILAPLVVLSTVLALKLDDQVWGAVMDVADSVLFLKSASGSAVERQALNAQAIVNFVDTYGLGAGAGSVRASSFALAVLANVGVPGAICYTLFLSLVFFRRPDFRNGTYEGHVRSACRWAAFGVLVAATISGTLVDLGELFFVFAAVATTRRTSSIAHDVGEGSRSTSRLDAGPLRGARSPVVSSSFTREAS